MGKRENQYNACERCGRRHSKDALIIDPTKEEMDQAIEEALKEGKRDNEQRNGQH